MFSKSNLGFLSLFALTLTSESALGREKWLERDGAAVYLYPRRLVQGQPAVLQKIRAACTGGVCDTLAGQAVTPLLAEQPECSQQDMADAIIGGRQSLFKRIAHWNLSRCKQTVRCSHHSKNDCRRSWVSPGGEEHPPCKCFLLKKRYYLSLTTGSYQDFTTNPPTLRNSVFCQKAPKNAQLNGLVQAQDPANNPNIFFDPALNASVIKGSQPNTAPFSGNLCVQRSLLTKKISNYGLEGLPLLRRQGHKSLQEILLRMWLTVL